MPGGEKLIPSLIEMPKYTESEKEVTEQ